MKLLLATRSEGKFGELERLFADTPIQLTDIVNGYTVSAAW